jgi:hypothetical protein
MIQRSKETAELVVRAMTRAILSIALRMDLTIGKNLAQSLRSLAPSPEFALIPIRTRMLSRFILAVVKMVDTAVP